MKYFLWICGVASNALALLADTFAQDPIHIRFIESTFIITAVVLYVGFAIIYSIERNK